MAKSLSTDTILMGIAIAWSLYLPFAPNTLFVLLDGIIGAFFLLSAAVLALSYGPLPGIVVFVAVALTFVERNRRTIQRKIIDGPTVTYKEQMAPSPPMSDDEIHPSYETPSEEEIPFYPEGDTSDSFEPVASDERQPIRTLTPDNDKTERLYINQGLGETELKEIPRKF